MQSNKILLALACLQTLLILILTYLVFAMESRTSDLAYEIAASRLSAPSAPQSLTLTPSSTTAPMGSSLKASETRLIVREEIERLADRLVKDLSITGERIQPSAPTVSANDIARIHASAASQISAMSSFGAATPSAMAKFEDTIVNLPAKERQAAMRKFMKAVNQGDIQTNF